ncbi:MAG: AAA family ATPase [bacterium]|nr:AAA family ATPase [bacterium]
MDPSAQDPLSPTTPQDPGQKTFSQLQSANMRDQTVSSDQLRKLAEKIEKAVIPQQLRDNLIERISRLALIRSSSGFMSATYILEYEATASYVTWVVGLPWDTMSQDLLDLVKAKEILDKNHYGLDPIKDRIVEYLATIMLNTKIQNRQNIAHAPILCLVGLAGTGKTTLAASIAQALGKKFERIPFGGMGDARALRGQSRAFPDAEPGLIVKKLFHCKTKNPVVLLDELDRVTDTARADIMGVLVELLDPEQNQNFTDHYIDYPFDLSNILFIATANNTNNISTAVLDRLEIIQMPSYSDQEKIIIAKQYLFKRIRDQAGLAEGQLTMDESVWPGLIRPLGFDSGIRSLERTIEGICRKAARQIVEGKVQTVRVDATNIKDYLPHW